MVNYLFRTTSGALIWITVNKIKSKQMFCYCSIQMSMSAKLSVVFKSITIDVGFFNALTAANDGLRMASGTLFNII